jgi:L-iditol 2-dehydrogenase
MRQNIDSLDAHLPSMMKALVLQEPGVLELRNLPVPKPGPGEVLVKVKAATTCGTDLKAFLRGHPQIPMPGVFGHEYSGIVAAVGDGAPFEPGDAVMGVHSAPCQECFWCRHDQENLCESIMSTKVLGSYAEYLLVPARIARLNLFHKPESLSFEVASLLEPLSCVAEAMRQLKVGPQSSVLIIGPGAIGLLFVAALKQLGVKDLMLAGRKESRLKVGTELGASACSMSNIPTGNHKYDLVIECTGSVEVWEKSIDFARRGGTVVLFGGCAPGTRVSFETKRIHYDQITLVSPFHFGTKAVQMAREWLLNPEMNLTPLISGERSLDQGKKVFEELKAGIGLKYVFKP